MLLGAAIDFTGITLPFSVQDLVGSGNALLGIVGSFVLLGLAFVLVPKLISLILFVVCCLNVTSVFAGYTTATFEADADRMRVDFDPNGVYEYKVEYFRNGEFIFSDSWQGSGMVTGIHYFTCNGSWKMTFFNFSGGVIGTDTVNVTQVLSEPEGCTAPPPKDGECIGCDLFECPGWDSYMGKVDQIIGKIPPAPDWQQVANTFRDTIAPRIKADMEDLLGYAPTPPNAPIPPSVPMPPIPSAPGEPPLPEDLDDRDIKSPSGKEAPGLEESTFDEDDIKNGAPKIPERTDPTGGFKILDPISGLPSQEEFEKNKPIEGEAPLPTDPKDPDNFSPKPEEGENKAPTPPEQDNYIPTDPGDPDNYAPTPGDDTGTAPLPNENGTAPIPGDSNDTAPLPNDNGTAPLPGN
ncbi:hypothetical protein RirG_002930 [Rhizophagus irregularis DAOM 197198w]|uniref:Uncharacterized protein n=1 Tax=Rhizophagus irregularis (strain DAOM 197198w) TaxID=1432141 RepID=A0A015NJX2_RHIIW|nr:hypothetical protein RirG_002930 [Rhizophagus irregularis DAOM 197198w]